MTPQEFLVLTPREVRGLLTIDECIAAVEHAFRLSGAGKAVPPAVVSLHAPHCGFHVKAGLLDLDRHYFASKVNGNFPDNHNRFGLPTIQGVLVLCDADNGCPLAVMDSREITSLRTGAATAVAAKHLARADSTTVTICGCGTQGRVQLNALARVCQLHTVFAYDKSEEQALRFAREVTQDLEAAITGDFVLLGSEVNPVIKALRGSGIEVTALHSHMLTEEPRLFFMHFWTNDDAVKLAKGLKAALDLTNSAK